MKGLGRREKGGVEGGKEGGKEGWSESESDRERGGVKDLGKTRWCAKDGAQAAPFLQHEVIVSLPSKFTARDRLLVLREAQ